MSKDQGEGDYAIRVLAADAYLNTAEDYSVKKAEAMLRDLNDGKMPDLKFGKDNANGPALVVNTPRRSTTRWIPKRKRRLLRHYSVICMS
jgi:hypothetical protein